MLNSISIQKDMSQFVRLEGTPTVQRAYCALNVSNHCFDWQSLALFKWRNFEKLQELGVIPGMLEVYRSLNIVSSCISA